MIVKEMQKSVIGPLLRAGYNGYLALVDYELAVNVSYFVVFAKIFVSLENFDNELVRCRLLGVVFDLRFCRYSGFMAVN